MGHVARLAGVGPMIGSRLLSGSGPVSTESAARIRWAVQKLDYRSTKWPVPSADSEAE
jgi:DNA-binding LacI/PurR family transcriptional regulator